MIKGVKANKTFSVQKKKKKKKKFFPKKKKKKKKKTRKKEKRNYHAFHKEITIAFQDSHNIHDFLTSYF